MNRRDTIKSLLVGTVAGGAILSTEACQSAETSIEKAKEEVKAAVGEGYGRFPHEIEHDAKLQAMTFFNDHEMDTIATICDIILPANEEFGSATDAEVPAFIEFMAKDLPYHQLPLRGGIAWIDIESNKRFGKVFKDCSQTDQIAIVEDIADLSNTPKGMEPGSKFFNLMRNLTLTGYYTSRIGLDDLGYDGNYANVWDGVPEDVLQKHGLSYDEEWLAKCVDQSKRDIQAEWDENMNLIS